MNKQRTVIYAERRRVLEGHNLRPSLTEIIRSRVEQAVSNNAPDNVHPHEWDRQQIITDLETSMRNLGKRVTPEQLQPLSKEEMIELIAREADAIYSEKEERMIGRYKELDSAGLREALRTLERATMLQIIDRLWIDHLYTMDTLKQGIGLRGWGQKDPRVEYEKEAFELFEDLKASIQEDFLAAMFQGDDFHIVVQGPDGAQQPMQPSGNGAATIPAQSQSAPQGNMPLPDARTARRFEQLQSNRDESSAGPSPVRKAEKKVGRNDPCPCGSGKKYKKCHGMAAV